MAGRTLLIGFDAAEAGALAACLPGECVHYEMLPRVVVERGRLFAAARGGPAAADRVVFHGIFEHDHDFLAGLALWGGPCFPNAKAMLDCRLRLPCLVRALAHTRFGGPRDYAGPGAEYAAPGEAVAKWGDWHCGENKRRFTGGFTAEAATLVEPFIEGEAVRVTAIGGRSWQVRMAGAGWLKSVHGAGAELMPADAELVADTQAVRRGLGLDVIGNDYILGAAGPYLLEVNHIPSLSGFPELWRAYVDAVASWGARAAGV